MFLFICIVFWLIFEKLFKMISYHSASDFPFLTSNVLTIYKVTILYYIRKVIVLQSFLRFFKLSCETNYTKMVVTALLHICFWYGGAGSKHISS